MLLFDSWRMTSNDSIGEISYGWWWQLTVYIECCFAFEFSRWVLVETNGCILVFYKEIVMKSRRNRPTNQPKNDEQWRTDDEVMAVMICVVGGVLEPSGVVLTSLTF